jgi:hypothetical protein
MLRVPESPADDDAKRPTLGPDSSAADRQECKRRQQPPRIEQSDIVQKKVTVPVILSRGRDNGSFSVFRDSSLGFLPESHHN